MFAPTVNSYKRYQPESWAPTALAWSVDNRTCGFRIVGHGASFRLESRIPGADANPYLAFAATIAAGLARHRARHRARRPRFDGNAYAADDVARVPSNIVEAIDAFATSKVAADAFGTDVHDHLAEHRPPGVGALQPRRHRLGTPPQLRPMVSCAPAARRGHRPPPRPRSTGGRTRARGRARAATSTRSRAAGAVAGARSTRSATRAESSTASTRSCSPAAPTSTPRATAQAPHPKTYGVDARRRRLRARARRDAARPRGADARDLPRLPGPERRARAARCTSTSRSDPGVDRTAGRASPTAAATQEVDVDAGLAARRR